MRKKLCQSGIAAIGILVLILDAKTALEGAQCGIKLCTESVIPSIFPFLVLTCIVNSVMMGSSPKYLRALGKILKIPAGTEMIFITGLLGGYPTGAQAISQSWRNNQIDRFQARRMLAFCNNAGPAFIFGILSMKFAGSGTAWALWGIHILSAVTVGLLLPGKRTELLHMRSKSTTWTKSLQQSVHTMAVICGWIVLFRVFISFLDRWLLWAVPISVRVIIWGVLELANGCCNLQQISLPGLRFVIASGLLSFGGLCITMQTASVSGNLGIKHYLYGKMLQTAISVALSIFMQYILFEPWDRFNIPSSFLWVSLIFVTIIVISRRITKKTVAFRPLLVYNSSRTHKGG